MKKSNTLTRSIIAFVLATLMVLSAFVLLSGNQVANADAPVLNKTATIKTTLDTRISKEVGAVKQKAIEFDLIDSDLKSAKNLAWFDTHAPCVNESAHPNGAYYTLGYSGPSVQFALDSFVADFGSSMEFMLTNTEGNTKGFYGKGGFEYNANGIIRVFANPTPATNGSYRRIYAVTEIVDGELQWNADSPYFSLANTHPAGPYYYGDISEVKNFLNPGYSYKVELFLGKINADGTITYGNTVCQNGSSNSNYSIAVFKKALGADEWELSFGWYVGREVYAGPFAGMEIISGMNTDESALGNNTELRGTYRPEKYNTVTMEIDNLAIYGNRNRDSVTTFDGVSNSAFYLNDEEGITSGLGTYSNVLGQCFGWPTGGSWDLNEFTVNGIDFTLANTAPAYMATYATCNLNTYKNVTAVIGEYSEVGYISAVDGEYFIELPDSDFDLADYDLEGYVLIGWLDDAGNLYKPAEVVTLEDVSTTFTAVYGSIVNYDKASVRVKDNEGIRFMATVGGNVATLDPSAYAFSVTFTEGTKTLTGDIDKSKLFANGNGTYSFYSVLTGLDGLESTVFKADANVTITYHDGSTLTFSAEDMIEGRSYIQVVTAALNDVSEVQDAEYFYEVTVGSVTAYSRYANEHFNAMLEVYEDVIGSAFEFDAQ